MKFSISDLWRTDGGVDRGTYVLVGVIGFVLKHNIDRVVAATFFNRSWSLFNYLQPGGGLTTVAGAGGPGTVAVADVSNFGLYATLVAIAIPFIWTGVALTLRRLHATRLPPLLVLFFFLPVVNLLFFLVMAALPSATSDRPPRSWDPHEALQRVIPTSALGSIVMAIGITAVVGGVMTTGAVLTLGEYGLGLFVALPFALGLCSVLLYGIHHTPSLSTALLISVGAIAVVAMLLIAAAIEGVVCLVMAAPIGGSLGALGGVLGWAILREGRTPHVAVTLSVMLLSVPMLMGAEALQAGSPSVRPLVTTLKVDAPPERVWENVVALTELPPVSDFVLSLGIAYPLRAELHGTGVGAIRHCVFTTGEFVEPITEWDPPHLLRFDVTSQPPAMQEMSPWGVIDAPHLDDYLVSRGGQFRLTPTASGGTVIEATTWYEHKIRPALYWQQWSDAILHRIHLRVLRHVKTLSESPS